MWERRNLIKLARATLVLTPDSARAFSLHSANSQRRASWQSSAGSGALAGVVAVIVPNQAERSDHEDTVRGEAQHHLQITMPDHIGDCRILGHHQNIAQLGNVHVDDLRLRRSC